MAGNHAGDVRALLLAFNECPIASGRDMAKKLKAERDLLKESVARLFSTKSI